MWLFVHPPFHDYVSRFDRLAKNSWPATVRFREAVSLD